MAKFSLLIYRPKMLSKCRIKFQDSLKCGRKLGVKLIFWMQIKINVLCKLILSFLVDLAGHACAYQSIWDNKYAISLLFSFR